MKKLFLLIASLLALNRPVWAEDLRSDTVDILAISLKLDLTDFTSRILHGEATIGCKAKMNGVDALRLDLLRLNLDTIEVDGINATYSYNDSVIDIDLMSSFNSGDSFTVRVVYHGHPLQLNGDFGGFYWTSLYAFNIGVSFLADPHTYGRVWFPCFDNFRERSLYEFFIMTKNVHKAFCNGLLEGVSTSGLTKTWHWKLNEEIPSYLASVAVSDYQTLSDTLHGIGGIKKIELAARAADTTAMKNLFVHLHDAFHIFENLWGEYQWDRVGYCIVPFNAGAMEHATNISFMQYYLNLYSAECENTMAHELSHHWFGDLVTCDSASEMWLNEAWAVYSEMVFHEKYYGTEDYKQQVRINHEHVLHKAHLNDGTYIPVSGVSSENTYGTTVYDKGSDVIHTLRSYMGDSLFFKCVKNYLRDFSWKNSSTAQLRDYLSSCSGIDLNNYFSDWVYSPGFPHFSIENITREIVIVATESYERVHFTIRQRLHHADHYYSNVPVIVSYFVTSGGRFTDTIMVRGECTDHTSTFGGGLTYITFFALDFDEQLQDAITDEWKMISDTGTFDFGTAKMILHLDSIAYPQLIRVEHNWIRPEPMKAKIPSLHLHDNRYWTVDGTTYIQNINAEARIDYDGTDVSLDASFINNSEDSLAVMYRPNSDSEWVFTDSFSINNQGSSADKKGFATIYNLKKGQYCFAIWNSSIADTTTNEVECLYSSVAEITSPANEFQLFPNPAREMITIKFEKNIFLEMEWLDLTGRKIMEQKISAEQNSIDLKLTNISDGAYLITLKDKEGNRITKKMMKQ